MKKNTLIFKYKIQNYKKNEFKTVKKPPLKLK